MDYQIADYQDYVNVTAHVKKLAESYKKVVEAADVNEGDQACQDRDDLMEQAEHAFNDWQDSFSDSYGGNSYD